MAVRKTAAKSAPRAGRSGAPAPMDPLALITKLEKGDFPGVLYVEGSDEAIKTAFLADLRRAWATAVPESPTPRIVRTDDGIDDILAAYQTVSMFASRELTIVFSVEKLVRSDKQIKTLADGLATPSSGSCLVLVEAASDKPRKKLDPLREVAQARLEVGAPDERGLIEWGRRRLLATGNQAEAGVLQALLDACERDPLAFLNEAGKLGVLAGDGGTVTMAHVKTLTAPKLGAELPDFILAVAQGDAKRAAQRLERILAAGESEGTILWSLGHLASSSLVRTSAPYSWAMYKEATAALARRRNAVSLARAVDAVYRAEAAWKGGRTDVRSALEQATRDLVAN
jgi:DNA polymerase III delta subunit